MIALRLSVEERVERDNAKDSGERSIRFNGDVLNNFVTQEFAGIVFLDFFQDAEQSAGSALVARDHLIDERVFPGVRLQARRRGLHGNFELRLKRIISQRWKEASTC
jgi:hypothetical protein